MRVRVELWRCWIVLPHSGQELIELLQRVLIVVRHEVGRGGKMAEATTADDSLLQIRIAVAGVDGGGFGLGVVRWGTGDAMFCPVRLKLGEGRREAARDGPLIDELHNDIVLVE